MLRKVAQHAAVVTLYCTGIVLGLVVGIWIGAESPWPDLAALLGAALGAAITVMGAFWVSDHRAEREREQLRQILLDGVKRLAEQAGLALGEAPTSEDARKRAREVFGRWQYLAAFSPYRELDAFEQVRAMAEVDACCRQLLPYVESLHEDHADLAMATKTVRKVAIARREGDAVASIRGACDEIVRRCNDAEKALLKQ